MKRILLPVLFLLLIPGCADYVASVKKSFKESDYLDINANCAQDLESFRRDYLRDDIIHNQCRTIDSFWVLWKSEEIMKLHTEILHEGSGHDDKALQQRLIAIENDTKKNSYFYVLMNGDKKNWKFSIEVNGRTYAPRNIKRVDLDYAYITILGRKATRFRKNAYLLEFPVKAERPLTLFVSDAKFTTSFEWCE